MRSSLNDPWGPHLIGQLGLLELPLLSDMVMWRNALWLHHLQAVIPVVIALQAKHYREVGNKRIWLIRHRIVERVTGEHKMRKELFSAEIKFRIYKSLFYLLVQLLWACYMYKSQKLKAEIWYLGTSELAPDKSKHNPTCITNGSYDIHFISGKDFLILPENKQYWWKTKILNLLRKKSRYETIP